MRDSNRYFSLLRKFFLHACLASAVAGMFAAHTGWAAEPPSPAAIVFYNAHVFTAEYDHPYADAVAIRGERIIAVGDLSSVERTAGPSARRVDLHGKFLMPGMIDAHAHPIFGGQSLLHAAFPDTSDSISALVNFVGEQMDKNASRLGDVLVIYDLDIGYWSHAAEIDAQLSSGRFARQPIVLFGSDGHTIWANAPARARAGITADYLRSLPPEQRSYYGFDGAFKPNGFAVDVGENKIEKSLPTPTPESMLAAGQAAVHYMNQLGITGWLDAAATGGAGGDMPARTDDPGVLPVYQELARRGELTVHVAAYPVVRPDSGLGQIEVVEAFRAKYKNIPNLSIPGLKVFADGVVEIPSQTAALTKPYRNNGRSTPVLFTQTAMNPARSLLDAGTVIAGASDWPVSTANPFAAIYQAETRVGPQGVLDAGQRMPREAMLYAYTRNSAQVLNQLDSIGSIAPGKLADLVLVDRDVLTVPAQELKEASVVWTMLGGKVVYGAGP